MARLTVVLSQAPGKHPIKRGLEESLAAALIMQSGLDVSIVPNLYDLGPDHTGRMFLESIKGDVVVLSWLYPRAAYWLLDRNDIRGQFGETLLKPPSDDDDDAADEAAPKPEVLGNIIERPARFIYTLDLRDANRAEPFIAEILRIRLECEDRARTAAANAPIRPPVMVELGLPKKATELALDSFSPEALLAPANRRWYPVIDYNRCTNCLECLDFCLFGVYGVDSLDRIVTENQDQCKKGCPACSRVCPEQAIIFPEYKSAAIAGAETGVVSGLKIDLSKLFGGEPTDALGTAVAERDRELVAEGRTAVGMAVGIPKRQFGKVDGPKDDLDRMIDGLDMLDI